MTSPLLVVSRLVAPDAHATPIAEARESYAYWTKRADALPWHRRSARRDARVHASRWRARLLQAHLERWQLRTVARVAMPVLDTRGRSAAVHGRSLALTAVRRTAIGRRVLVAAVVLAAAGIATAAVIAGIALHLLT